LDTAILEKHPELIWQEEPSKRWLDLCNQLQAHQHKVPSVNGIDPQRKWEFVSAYQKCVRRGLLDQAIWLLGGFHSIFKPDPKEKAYFWKRICTTACEDVGYGDPEFMNFVLVCSAIYTPSKVENQQLLKIWSFLTEQMCRTKKSRIYCQLSIMEEMLRMGIIPERLDEWETALIAKITAPVIDTPRQQWAEKNNWRGEGMVHFQHFTFAVVASDEKTKPFETMGGLPDFAYDMHTRVGLRALSLLSGHSPFKKFIEKHPSNLGKNKTLGWSLFFAEGGKIENRIYDPKLDFLEAKVIATQFGWQIREWRQLVKYMEEAVANGKVHSLRSHILASMPYSQASQV
jgi:hypothetical protein